jgi:hypothetical protein
MLCPIIGSDFGYGLRCDVGQNSWVGASLESLDLGGSGVVINWGVEHQPQQIALCG